MLNIESEKRHEFLNKTKDTMTFLKTNMMVGLSTQIF